MWTVLLLAATVRSFAHMPLGISDCNKMVLWRGCEGRADQKQLRKALLQLFLPTVIDDYKRSDTSFHSTRSWSRKGSLRQFFWLALKCFFGLYFKYFINLQTLELEVALPRCLPWLHALWQPYSDCRLQTSAGIRDWAKFMCASIR